MHRVLLFSGHPTCAAEPGRSFLKSLSVLCFGLGFFIVGSVIKLRESRPLFSDVRATEVTPGGQSHSRHLSLPTASNGGAMLSGKMVSQVLVWST